MGYGLFCVCLDELIIQIYKLYHGRTVETVRFDCIMIGCVSVSQALRENTNPFLAMIMLKDRKMTVVGRLEGLIQPEDLINQLTFIMDANQTHLTTERLERYWKLISSHLT